MGYLQILKRDWLGIYDFAAGPFTDRTLSAIPLILVHAAVDAPFSAAVIAGDDAGVL